jgi:hypothetical protein
MPIPKFQQLNLIAFKSANYETLNDIIKHINQRRYAVSSAKLPRL